MTLDDLVQIGDAAARSAFVGQRETARIRAIVEALRDELSARCTDFAWTGADLEQACNEIIASDVGEAARDE